MKTKFKTPILIYVLSVIIGLIGTTLFSIQTAISFSRILMATGLILFAVALGYTIYLAVNKKTT